MILDYHTLLCYLKPWFGLGGTVLKRFISYLSNCCRAIKINSTLSELSKVFYGVPQGFVLGLLLFSRYTTPLCKTIGFYPDIKFLCRCHPTICPSISQKCSCCSLQVECLLTGSTMMAAHCFWFQGSMSETFPQYSCQYSWMSSQSCRHYQKPGHGSTRTFLSQNILRRFVKPASSRCMTFIELYGILSKKWLSFLQMP